MSQTILNAPFAYVGSNIGSGSFSLGTGANRYIVKFIPSVSDYLNSVRTYIAGVSATVPIGALTCGVYTDSHGNLGTLLESVTNGAAVTAAGVVEWTGFTSASTLTRNIPHYLVFSSSSSNTASFHYIAGLGSGQYYYSASTPTASNFGAMSSADSGVTLTAIAGLSGTVIQYNSGIKDGFPLNSGLITGPNQAAYANREYGTRFATPLNATLRISGVVLGAAKVGSPTGNMRARIYGGNTTTPTLLGTSETVYTPAGCNTSATGKIFYFGSNIVVPPNTVLRVVVSETTQSDSSANRYGLQAFNLNSVDASIFYPWSSIGVSTTLTTDGGATFTDTANSVATTGLILDNDLVFNVNGWMLGQGMSGGMNG